MQETFSNSEIKNSAKIALTGNYTRSGLLLLFYFMLTSMLQRYLNFHPLLSVLPMILSNMLLFGIYLFFLKLSLDQEVSPFDLFFAFQDSPKKTLCIACLYTAFTGILELPANILLNAFFLQRSLSDETLKLLLGLQIALLVIWYLVHLNLSLVYYLLLDFPELTIKEILLLSVSKMRGQKLRLFLLELSFLPVFLLAIPTMGIGLLWIMPYFYTARSKFYLNLVH